MQSGDSSSAVARAETPLLFREVQRFRHWFFWLPVIIATGVVWWQFGQQVILGNPQGSEPIPDWLAWVLTIVFGIGLPVIAVTVRMVTEVTPGLLTVRFMPLRARKIPVREIDDARSREYSPMREFGGWGIKIGADGRAYNAHGTMGVQLTLRDGGRILIGTQRADELLDALRTAGASLE